MVDLTSYIGIIDDEDFDWELLLCGKYVCKCDMMMIMLLFCSVFSVFELLMVLV